MSYPPEVMPPGTTTGGTPPPGIPTGGVPVPPLTNQQKQDWNGFIDFVDKSGYKGNPVLDDRNQQLGSYLMQKYRSLNPKATITYQDVPRVQSALQEYRTNLVNQWKAGKVAPMEGVKTEADIMPQLSEVDGWLGSKTSSHRFPVAVATNADGTKTNYGVNTAAYDKERGIK